jgi:signal transduction histidine kinase
LFNVRQLLADVAGLVDPACQHARVAFSQMCEHEGGPLDIKADRSSLRAAVLNLTMNAIEAAGQGGTVSLEAFARDREVSIAVVDSGPGPPSELADELFEPFVTSKKEGVGLGLALAHQVAVDHGGQLSWTRAAGATRFLLTLPRANGTHKGAE